MAKPLRFRRSTERWTEGKVHSEIYQSLDSNLGATMSRPWFKQPTGYDARRFEMDNGDIALFAWREDGNGAYWVGNTETPSTLWRTNKVAFGEAPDDIAEWAQTELLAQLHEESPWLADYPTLSWFFLPVFLSKDGRHTTRRFFEEHAAGFPDASRDEALSFYEGFLSTGVIEDRHVMAGKLGTAKNLNLGRMSAAMSEFTVAKILHDAGYEVTPEIEISTGHFIDFRVDQAGEETTLVEVTRPLPTERRSASSPVTAIRQTAQTKTSGQLQAHGGGVTLFVDCSSFDESDWQQIRQARPTVGHKPAVVFRARPDGSLDGYTIGSVPLTLPESIAH